MTTFDERRNAFDAKYAHDQELLFKIVNRRNRLLGEWAAELMGLQGDDAATYAKEVIASDFDEPGDEDVFRKVAADLAARDVSLSEHLLRRKMEELLTTARGEINADN